MAFMESPWNLLEVQAYTPPCGCIETTRLVFALIRANLHSQTLFISTFMTDVATSDFFTTIGCFALLDDQQAPATEAASRLYTGHVGTLQISDAGALDGALTQMQQALAQGLHAITLLSHELGAELHSVQPREPVGHANTSNQLSQILLFSQCEHLTAEQVAHWLQTREQPPFSDHVDHVGPAGIVNLHASVGSLEFAAALARIHAYIQAGDSYQINYTYRLRFDAYGSPLNLYQRLRERQPVPYGALIGLPDGSAVLSLSPELFVRHRQGALQAQPMKGTAPAGTLNPQDDAALSAALASDPKNRAENVMIVDLLRNDFSRVAEAGSVSVPKLFEVERFGDVLQMTSTICARLRADVGLAELLRAVLPCGSIVGAPKRRSLEIIRELEVDARGIYTGAIGWFEPPTANAPPSQLPDFCLSVPIRTLTLAPLQDGLRAGEMGVGAGIVHDSQPQAEYEECQLKAHFLTGLGHAFELFETLYASREEGVRHLARHLKRLAQSAAALGFPMNQDAIAMALAKACAALPAGIAHRLRLALDDSGQIKLQSAPLLALAGPVRVLLASEATDANDFFLRHKTTLRARYDAGWRTAEAEGAFDMLFFNAEGELTEGGRSNVFVKLQGRWCTPPLACGVLPGVMRSVLLDDPDWRATERRLTRDDLLAAEALVLCNALRGTLPATLG
jgi:para-aminobenzoate synthetase/4-amino-4-deoxychorismate lyase